MTAANPFALMLDPAQVHEQVERSEQLRQLSLRRCHPLDRKVIRCASADMAAADAKIDRTTTYLPPEHEEAPPLRRGRPRLN